MKKMVSIITPSYNSSRFITYTIESVISQTYTDWEMIIVDDCSKDNSVDVIKQYLKKDTRIKLVILEKNIGAAEARNVALRQAKGRYIAFLDSDDLWMPSKLEIQLEFMKKQKCAFSFSSYELISETGDNLQHIIRVPDTISYKQYLRNTIIGCLTVIIDKEETGNFEMPNIKSSHDMALWLLILKKGFKAYGINIVLAQYRLVTTSNTAQKSKAAKDVWRVYRNIEKLSLLYSAFNFVMYAVNATIKRIR